MTVEKSGVVRAVVTAQPDAVSSWICFLAMALYDRVARGPPQGDQLIRLLNVLPSVPQAARSARTLADVAWTHLAGTASLAPRLSAWCFRDFGNYVSYIRSVRSGHPCAYACCAA